MSDNTTNENDTLTIPMEEFFETSCDLYDEFDRKAWEKGVGYTAPNYPIFTDKMEGLDEGLYLFAGESNMGKSAIVNSLVWDICTNPENKLYGIYFALDDTASDIIPRIIAMTQSIPISVAAKPQRYQNLIDEGHENAVLYQEWLQKRTAGIQMLKDHKEHFKIVDGTTIESGEQILDFCRKAQIYVKSIDPENDIIVCIDSMSDITFAEKHFKSDKELNDHIAKQVKKWAVEVLHCPIIGTLHLRKIEQNRRPNVADVKESGRYVYEASALFLVHNDVSRNKQSAAIYSTQEGIEEKLPVIELDWAKNKKSSYKGRTYHHFQPNFSRVRECSKDAMDRFNHLIYSV